MAYNVYSVVSGGKWRKVEKRKNTRKMALGLDTEKMARERVLCFTESTFTA